MSRHLVLVGGVAVVAALASLTGGATAQASQAGHVKPTTGQLQTIAAVQRPRVKRRRFARRLGRELHSTPSFSLVQLLLNCRRRRGIHRLGWNRLPKDQIVFGCYPSLSYKAIGIYVDPHGHRSSAPALDTGTKGLKCRGDSTGLTCPIVGVGS